MTGKSTIGYKLGQAVRWIIAIPVILGLIFLPEITQPILRQFLKDD